MQCNTYDELEKQVKSDVSYAALINSDRVSVIESVFNEVIKKKGWNDCVLDNQ